MSSNYPSKNSWKSNSAVTNVILKQILHSIYLILGVLTVLLTLNVAQLIVGA